MRVRQVFLSPGDGFISRLQWGDLATIFCTSVQRKKARLTFCIRVKSASSASSSWITAGTLGGPVFVRYGGVGLPAQVEAPAAEVPL